MHEILGILTQLGEIKRTENKEEYPYQITSREPRLDRYGKEGCNKCRGNGLW